MSTFVKVEYLLVYRAQSYGFRLSSPLPATVFTRDARICYRPSVRLSVCPFVTRVDQS